MDRTNLHIKIKINMVTTFKGETKTIIGKYPIIKVCRVSKTLKWIEHISLKTPSNSSSRCP